MDFLLKNFWELTVTGLTQGSIYALVALGYTLVYGVLRLINFAHSEVFMVGTFGALFALEGMGLDANSNVTSASAALGYLIVAALAAAAASGVTAVVVERVAYRPLRRRNAPTLVFLITAIGASLAMSEGFAIWRGRDNEAFPTVIDPKTQFKFFDATVSNLDILIFLTAIVMMFSLDTFMRRTRLGRGVRAVAQDPDSAALMGVNKDRVISLTFLLGGIMAGGAAILYGLRFGVTKYDVGFLLGVKAFTAAVLGGIGNLRGALIGGLALGLVENYGSAIVGSQWRDVVAYVTLVVVLMFRPTGILGESLGKARA
ncbi:MAG: branched-chain amino acid transport system permease protein [Actinomycetota bacterium]|jgi:branched-chain amino acid transport system permease protein|nr:branched-chain amino acid transport system permease protein [Actinomycetota bacterium]